MTTKALKNMWLEYVQSFKVLFRKQPREEYIQYICLFKFKPDR